MNLQSQICRIVASLVQRAFIFFPEPFELGTDDLPSADNLVSVSFILWDIYNTAMKIHKTVVCRNPFLLYPLDGIQILSTDPIMSFIAKRPSLGSCIEFSCQVLF